VADLKTAQKVEADLKSGKDFAAEARQYSIDPGSKDKGGELGPIRHGQMVPAFDAAVFSLPVNVISQPVKSPFGYHIIQVESRDPGQKATLANSRDKIADLLRQQQEAPLIQPFLQDLQTKANIQISDPRFQAAFPTPEPTPPAAAAPPGAPANGAVPAPSAT
jgi:foldase protein PrsA